MSDFYVRKIKTFFQRIDVDKDGKITQKDFEDIADRFVTREHLDAARGAELKAKLVQAWERYFKESSGNEPLNEDGCVALFKKLLATPAGQETIRNTTTDLMHVYFTAIDANADGSIQSGEYELFFEVNGIDKALAPPSFQAIDTNNDTELSLDEFVAAGLEFFLGEDESSPTKLFWGPLV